MISILSPIDAHTGYGITGYNIVKNLNDIDKKPSLFPIGGINMEQSWDQKSIKDCLNHQNRFDTKNPCLKIWHDTDFFTRSVGNSKYGALSFFEINRLSEVSKLGYNLLDIIFMPSTWAKNVLEDNGIKKEIIVCPQGVDSSIFDYNLNNNRQDQDNKYIFINIGKFEIRKGHDILVDIFNKAFTSEDNVELWMINHNPFLNQQQTEQWHRFYKNSKLADKIKIFPRLPSQKVVAEVISQSDCGIFPSRGEGWNNEAIEMMAMNKPIIITDYSAHTEYCNKDNSYLIKIDNLTSAIDDMWFDGSGEWAEIGDDQIDQTIEHMRYVVKNNIRSNPNGLKTAQYYTWNRTAEIIYQNLGV